MWVLGFFLFGRWLAAARAWSLHWRPTPPEVLRIFLKILVMGANFGDFDIDFKILKNDLVTRVRPYWDKFWKILTFAFWWNRKVMINHRGGILIFCQILSKLKFLDFRVKDFKFCDP